MDAEPRRKIGLALARETMESMLVMGRVRSRVRELRLERGWTQQDLADAVGVSRQSINAIECDRYEPSLDLALTIARAFGRPTDSIFELKGKR